MRDVEGRLAAYKANPSKVANRCAERVMLALDVPRQFKDNATQMAQAVPKGKMQQGRAPRGAIVYWDKGATGHGHCCFALGDGTELSVDVIKGKPGVAGVVPFTWFAKNWPALRYLGWSWYWGSLDTEIKAPPPPAVKFPVGDAVLVERKLVTGNPITVTPEKWTTVGRINIPGKDAHYLNTIQVRLPGGTWAESRMVRVGWGKDPDGRDETGYHPFYPHPNGGDFSDSFTHPLVGGGPLEFQILLHGPKKPTVLPTVICKAFRDF